MQTHTQMQIYDTKVPFNHLACPPQVMIYELADHIQGFLSEHNKPPSSSFHEEMLKNHRRQQEMRAQEEQQKMDQRRRQEEETVRRRDRQEILSDQSYLRVLLSYIVQYNKTFLLGISLNIWSTTYWL